MVASTVTVLPTGSGKTRLGNAAITSEVSPAEARETLFVEAAVQTGKPRTAIVAAVASALGLAAAALERAAALEFEACSGAM